MNVGRKVKKASPPCAKPNRSVSITHMKALARKVLALVVASAGLLVAAPAPASAASPSDVCDVFPYDQSYTADRGFFRAPAWTFGQDVTVQYEDDACSGSGGLNGKFQLSVAGRATVYAGDDVNGRKLGTYPFLGNISGNFDGGKAGWPIDWWACREGSFSYTWVIPRVYQFSMNATDGKWSMVQRALGGAEGATGASFNGCRNKS